MAYPDGVQPASRLTPSATSDTEDPFLLSGASGLERSTAEHGIDSTKAIKRQRSRFSFANLFSSDNKDAKEPKKDIKHELKEVQHRNDELQKEHGELLSQVRTLQTNYDALQSKYKHLERENKLVRADKRDLEREMAEKIRLEAELKEAKNVIADLTEMKVSMEQIQLLTQIFEEKIEDIVPYSMYEVNMQFGDHNVIRGTIDQRVNNLLMAAKDSLKTAVGQHKAISEKAERLAMQLEWNMQHTALLTGLLQEIREELTNVRRVFPAGKLHINYVLSLTSDGDIIDRCVQCIRSLPRDDRHYTFDMLGDHEDAQLGVLRIVKKYGAEVGGRRIKLHRFARKLDQLATDSDQPEALIDKDSCARILVQWVRESTDNTSSDLKGMFPRIAQYSRVMPPHEIERGSSVVVPKWFSVDSMFTEQTTETTGVSREQFAELTDMKFALNVVKQTTEDININVKTLLKAQ